MSQDDLSKWADEFYGEPVEPTSFQLISARINEEMGRFMRQGEKEILRKIMDECVRKTPESH